MGITRMGQNYVPVPSVERPTWDMTPCPIGGPVGLIIGSGMSFGGVCPRISYRFLVWSVFYWSCFSIGVSLAEPCPVRFHA